MKSGQLLYLLKQDFYDCVNYKDQDTNSITGIFTWSNKDFEPRIYEREKNCRGRGGGTALQLYLHILSRTCSLYIPSDIAVDIGE